MSIEVKVPVLPESVSDATIANWRKKVGEAVARAIRGAGVQGVVLDVATRPQPSLAALAQMMDSRYVPLPRADARRIAATLG